MAFTGTRKNPYEDELYKQATAKLTELGDYKKSAAVLAAEQARAAHEANRVGDWTGGTYGQSLKDALAKLDNREKFTYDLNGDMLYNQYKDQYTNAGRLAMADTMGQAAALTGGYGNSYAATVGNQAYQSYLQKLNDKVPELYQIALNRYNQEGQDLKDNLAIQQALYGTEYGEYRDKVADWNTEQNRLDSNYFNESNMDYSRYSDNRSYLTNAQRAALDTAINEANTEYNNAFAKYQQDYNEREAAASRAAARAAADQSAQINELSSQINYYKAIAEIGNGITPVTRGNRGNTANGGYSVLGKTYSSKTKAEEALAKYLDSLNLTDAQINDIYAKLGM